MGDANGLMAVVTGGQKRISQGERGKRKDTLARTGSVRRRHALGWVAGVLASKIFVRGGGDGAANAGEASGFVTGGFGSNGGQEQKGLFGFLNSGDDEFYEYRTRDVAVDVISPLLAYRLVCWALGQKFPNWLDILLALATAAAITVVVTGV